MPPSLITPSLTPKERESLRTLNIEHLISTTIRLLERMRRYSDPAIAEAAQTAWIDWKLYRPIITKLTTTAKQE